MVRLPEEKAIRMRIAELESELHEWRDRLSAFFATRGSDPTMRELVKQVLPGRDTRDVLTEIERRYPGKWRKESIMVACSQLRTWGDFSKPALPDGAPSVLHITLRRDTRDVIDHYGTVLKILPAQVGSRWIEYGVDEDLLSVCPTLDEGAML